MRHVFRTSVELEVIITAHVTPATPARPCSDPDAAAYSDPGDPGERSIEAVSAIDISGGGKKPIDITACFSDRALELLAEEAYDDAMDKFDDTP